LNSFQGSFIISQYCAKSGKEEEENMQTSIEVENAEKRTKMNKTLLTVTIVASLVCVLLLILQLFLPALKVGQQASGAVYEYNTYNGIDVAFMCWPEFILGGELIGPNAVLIVAIVLPILLVPICSLMLFKSQTKKRVVLSIIMMVVFAFFAIAWLNLGTLVMNTAYAKFKEIVYYAKEKDMYGLHIYTICVSAMSLVAALLNLAVVATSVKSKN
jgi:hypothetical protein